MGVLLSSFIAGLTSSVTAGSAATVAGSAASAAATAGALTAAVGAGVGIASGITALTQGPGKGDSFSLDAFGNPTQESIGRVNPNSIEDQAAQRRLARLSKYFTSPTGVLGDANVGSTGVFS